MNPDDDQPTDDSYDEADENFVSKSQRKREATAAQELGRKLLELDIDALRSIELPDNLLAALEEARRIKKHGALKRQLQFIGKIMRKLDLEPVEAAYNQLSNHYQQDIRQFHHIEKWRDRLLAEGDTALGALLEEAPQADRQHLRQLIRQSKKESQANKPPKSAREIFRYLRELLG